SHDPATIRQLDWTLKNPASTSADALGRRAEVLDIEVIEPARLRHARKLGEHAADRLSGHRKQLIQVCRIVFSVGLLPAKKSSVKSKALVPIFSQQLVPAHAPGLVQPAGWLLAICQSIDQRKRRR